MNLSKLSYYNYYVVFVAKLYKSIDNYLCLLIHYFQVKFMLMFYKKNHKNNYKSYAVFKIVKIEKCYKQIFIITMELLFKINDRF